MTTQYCPPLPYKLNCMGTHDRSMSSSPSKVQSHGNLPCLYIAISLSNVIHYLQCLVCHAERFSFLLHIPTYWEWLFPQLCLVFIFSLPRFLFNSLGHHLCSFFINPLVQCSGLWCWQHMFTRVHLTFCYFICDDWDELNSWKWNSSNANSKPSCPPWLFRQPTLCPRDKTSTSVLSNLKSD